MKIGQIINHPKFKGDDNMCTLIANSMAFDLDYGWVYDFMSKEGREHGRGLQAWRSKEIIEKIAKKLGYDTKWYDGYDLHEMRSNDGGKYMTTANFNNYFSNGNYILKIKGHAVACVDGKIADYTKGRKFRIRDVCKITKDNVKSLTIFEKFGIKVDNNLTGIINND